MATDVPQASCQSEDPEESGTAILRHCIATEADRLQGTLAVYLHRAWAMSHAEAEERSREVLAEVVTTALRKAADFDPRRSPRAWLLGIGARLVLQQRDAVFAERRYAARPPPAGWDDLLAPDALLDRLAALTSPDIALTLEQAEAVATLLAPLSPEDRQVVRLGIINGLRGEDLAQVLQCRPGTARVRLWRAIQRLRSVWAQPPGENAEGSAV